MTYFADLTPYSYCLDPAPGDEPYKPPRKAVNVGWLDASHAFSVGEVPIELAARLGVLCTTERRHVMRGFHHCELCPTPAGGWPPASVTLDGASCYLGDAEIYVSGRDRTFIAPNLVIHYVTAHHYRPSDEFIAAVLRHHRPRFPAISIRSRLGR